MRIFLFTFLKKYKILESKCFNWFKSVNFVCSLFLAEEQMDQKEMSDPLNNVSLIKGNSPPVITTNVR